LTTSGVFWLMHPTYSPFKTFCDFSRNGGGWTLMVTSRTNAWTLAQVYERDPASDLVYLSVSALVIGPSGTSWFNPRFHRVAHSDSLRTTCRG
jgi:hypothetical protein